MPIPKKLEKTIKKFAKRDGKIAKKFFPYLVKPGDMPLYVLAQSGREKKWTILGAVDKWGVEFNVYWERTQFTVSTVRADFGKNQNETFHQIVSRASHLAKGNGELYKLRKGTDIQIFQFNFAYNVLADLENQKTFSLADAENEQ
jgi:hypothetical protein